MTDHTQNQDLALRRQRKSTGLNVVSSHASSASEEPDDAFPSPAMPRWSIYMLVAFYCAAVWALAYWIISTLF